MAVEGYEYVVVSGEERAMFSLVKPLVLFVSICFLLGCSLMALHYGMAIWLLVKILQFDTTTFLAFISESFVQHYICVDCVVENALCNFEAPV